VTIFDTLANTIAEKSFGGTLPPFAQAILIAALDALPVVKQMSTAEAQYFSDELFAALCRRIAEDGARLQAARLRVRWIQ